MSNKIILLHLLFLLALAACDTQEKAGSEETKKESEEVILEENAECPYRLPWSSDLGPVLVSQGVSNPDKQKGSHTPGSFEEFAGDYVLKEGQVILNARGGKIILLRSGSTEGGPNKQKYASKANFILVQHIDGTVGYYNHLSEIYFTEDDYGKVIQQGEPIGEAGHTGWATGDHLHFQVQMRTDGFGQSIPFCFSDVEGGIPQFGMTYISSQGASPFTNEPTVENPVITLEPEVGYEPLNTKDPSAIAAYLEKMMNERNFEMVEPLVAVYGAGMAYNPDEIVNGDEYYRPAAEFSQILAQRISASSKPSCIGWGTLGGSKYWLEVLFKGVIYTDGEQTDTLVFYLSRNNENTRYELWAAVKYFPFETVSLSEYNSCSND